jgi:hemerythrin-like domain-containing protein
MSDVTQAMHNHHRELMARLADHVTALMTGRPDVDAEGLVDFLVGDLLPHAAGEERYLYPAVDPLLRTYGRPTETMSVDHEFITRYVREIEDAVAALRDANADERPGLLGRLQRLAIQLDAIMHLHLDKEERVYLPLFERHLTDEEQRRVLDGMHEPVEVTTD